MKATRRVEIAAMVVHLAALVTGSIAVVFAPGSSVRYVLIAWLLTLVPLIRGWIGCRGTAARLVIVWGFIALGSGAIALLVGADEPISSGRDLAGLVHFIASLSVIAALVAVLNARRPGTGAWAILTCLMVSIFLFTWYQEEGVGPLLVHLRPVRLHFPWNVFLALLIVMGTTNYATTKFGSAAFVAAIGLAIEWRLVTAPDRFTPTGRSLCYLAIPLAYATSVWLAWVAGTLPARYRRRTTDAERIWFWFRDRWGVVWGLRVQDRFNQSAEARKWPLRLTWHGFERASWPSERSVEETIEEIDTEFRMMLRRFVSAERMAEVADRTCSIAVDRSREGVISQGAARIEGESINAS
jgi:hypothetical protein